MNLPGRRSRTNDGLPFPPVEPAGEVGRIRFRDVVLRNKDHIGRGRSLEVQEVLQGAFVRRVEENYLQPRPLRPRDGLHVLDHRPRNI